MQGFPGVWKLHLLRLPSRDGSILSSFLSLFIFYILSYLLSQTMGCFSGCLMTSASDQKLFCEVCSAFCYSFDEFVGEKVVSPSYSSAILAPPLKGRILSELGEEGRSPIVQTHEGHVTRLASPSLSPGNHPGLFKAGATPSSVCF